MLPDGAPAEWNTLQALSNAINARESAANAALGKSMDVALPVELSAEDQRKTVDEFIRTCFTANGYAVIWAIHNDADGHNPHAHIIIGGRPIDPKTGDWVAIKYKKTWALDENGQRIPIIDPATGQQKVTKHNGKCWKRVNVAVRLPLDQKDWLINTRQAWADCCNHRLDQANQISAESNAARGMEEVPTVHEGSIERARAARGLHSEVVEANKEIRATNATIAKLKAALKALQAQIK